MTLQIEDIISTVCSQFEASHNNDFQTVYTVDDPKEAKLAFDILVAFGFDAKVYHDDNKPSKLYVTSPTDALSEHKISDALIYANSLTQIKQTLDNLCAEDTLLAQSTNYSLTFSNAQSSGKQISVQITQNSSPSPAFASANISAPQPVRRPAQPANARPKRAMQKAVPDENTISSGPALTQRSYPGQIKAPEPQEDDGLGRQVSLYLRGNIATSSFAALTLIAFLALLFGLFVSAKTFLCPDFALQESKRNHSWYCKKDGDDEKKPVHFENQ